ncbi:MAG TPA: hypothetical protein VGC89_20620 [Pyrinomonadaceae bacterium]|jgi:hypothetical protein
MNFPLISGGRVRVTGTTAQARPELGGVVLEDQIRAFANGSVSGTLQDRVVRSSRDGSLAFYYRIRELRGGNINQAIVLGDWFLGGHVPSAVDADFRLDGLGEVGPFQMNFDGSNMLFEFSGWNPPPPPITPTALSRFMFIIAPGVTEYQTGGKVTISSTTFSAEIRNCFRPVIR